jgi:hypothetical protein
MNDKLAKAMRKMSKYRPGPQPKPEFPGVHHLLEVPLYATHTRTIREMGPRGKIIARKVEKILYGADGKTPLSPLWHQVKDKDGNERVVHKTEVVPILKPIRLLPGSPKANYRRLKRAFKQHEAARGISA